MGHEYALILGYPAEDGASTYSGYPRMTIANNYFYNCYTRAPGLMRYGYFHAYNNFVYSFHLAFTPYTGCHIYSEKNYFDKGSYDGYVVDDKGVGEFTDEGSVLSTSVSSIKTPATSWRPSSNYSYSTRDANSAKTWAQNYAGAQSSKITYAIG
jgi:pectate lyase